MGKERFKAQGGSSFWGDFVYDRVVGPDHFLRKLKEEVPWQRFTYKLVKWYRGRAKEGRPPYDPGLLLRMLLVSYLYNLSERQTEQAVNDNLPIKYFVGLAVDERAPDHSTLTAFKRRLTENGRAEAFEGMLAEVVQIALEREVEFGRIQLIDSTHSIADVNQWKEGKRKREGKPLRDAEARWGVKGTKQERDAKGKVVKVRKSFLGYKAHYSMDSQSGMITSMVPTGGHAHDGKQLPKLLEKDEALGLEIELVSADRGYDDSDNHVLLWTKGIHSAIHLNDYRTRKKDGNKEIWVAMRESEEYQRGRRERYMIERKFGEGKKWHGLGRCRYVGLVRYAIQGYMTAIVLNLKRLVILLTGVPFRGRARAVV